MERYQQEIRELKAGKAELEKARNEPRHTRRAVGTVLALRYADHERTRPGVHKRSSDERSHRQ